MTPKPKRLFLLLIIIIVTITIHYYRINIHLEEERISGARVQFKPVVSAWKMKTRTPDWWFICSSCKSSVLKERGVSSPNL